VTEAEFTWPQVAAFSMSQGHTNSCLSSMRRFKVSYHGLCVCLVLYQFQIVQLKIFALRDCSSLKEG